MKLLPDAGPQRRRLFLLIGALVVTYFVLSKFGGGEPLPIPEKTGPDAAASKPVVRTSGPRNTTRKPDATMPVALKLKQIEEVPDEPEAGRNLFRFGVPPPPPQPAFTPLPPPPPRVDPGPPPPPPIPPIPLKLTWVYVEAGAPNRAYLADKNTGAMFEATQGQIVDGRYKLLAVGASAVVMCYLDGTGQRTITLGGS